MACEDANVSEAEAEVPDVEEHIEILSLFRAARVFEV
jgi:hypothetical protein